MNELEKQPSRKYDKLAPKQVLVKIESVIENHKKNDEGPHLTEDIKGNRQERLEIINKFSKTHRPQGKVVAILNSPNQEREQMCMLAEMRK